MSDTFDFVITTPSDNTEFKFSVYDAVDFDIDWGDTNTDEDISSGLQTHNYVGEGTYTIKVSGTASRISFYGDGDGTPALLQDITSKMSDGVSGIDSAEAMFRGCTSIAEFTEKEWFDDVSGSVSSFSRMFNDASNFNCSSVQGWDMAEATTIGRMFLSASAFNQNIGGWNTPELNSMDFTFYNATNFNNGESDDINDLITSEVTQMAGTFRNSSFDQPIGKWDVSNVTSFGTTSSGFLHNTPFDQDLSAWDVSKGTGFDRFLDESNLSKENYDKLLNAWSQLDLNIDLDFHGGNSEYTLAGAYGKLILLKKFGWTITDNDIEDLAEYEVDTLEKLQAMGLHLDKDYKMINNIDAEPTEEWNELIDKGAWDDSTGYPANSFVTHGGDDYYAILANKDIEPGVHADWEDYWQETDLNAGHKLGWEPVGDGVAWFSGSFDGQNHKITGGLFSNRPEESRVGFIGENRGTVQNVEADVDLHGYEAVGLIGLNRSIISACTTKGGVTGDRRRIAGVAGSNYGGGNITDCMNEASIITNAAQVGGLAGLNTNTGVSIKNCINYGTVTSDRWAGGIIGYTNTGTIEESVNYGQITAIRWSAGGAVGCVSGGEISDTYSHGNVFAGLNTDQRGGLIGEITDDCAIHRCYSKGAVNFAEEGSNGGGLVGLIDGEATVTESANFWDTTTSGWTTSAMGVGRTTAQMKDIKTYTEVDYQDNGITAGQEWDMVHARDLIDETWAIVDGKTYPALYWQWVFNRADPELAETLRAIRKAEAELTTTLRALRAADVILTETLRAIREADPEVMTTLRAIREAETQAAETLRAVRQGLLKEAETLRAVREAEALLTGTLRAIRKGEPDQVETLRAVRTGDPLVAATLRAIRTGDIETVRTLIKYCNQRQHTAILETLRIHTATYDGARKHEIIIDCGGQENDT